MKKLIFAAVILLLSGIADMQAQTMERYDAADAPGFNAADTVNPRRATDFTVFYGAFPASDFIATYRDHCDLKNSWGTVGFAFNHAMTDRWSVGVSYNFSSSAGLDGHPAEGRDISAAWHTLMGTASFTYYRRGAFSAYARAGVGVTVGYLSPQWRDSYNITRFAFQISPMGFQYMFRRRLGAFVEAGLGMQGIVRAGLRVRFL